ncbi:MAG: 16S rRNA (guanine(966)-N(2))-methyltransferase RsmD [bacterium]|nr:16S rRNA (guanine(966)-N(2))-methyltransferase RsmD [bacterium]
MRITGGEFKNLRINAPEDIRPTQDSVRLAIFNVIGERIENANFIDLFAGSGAVGIEALSRGAEKIVFVDSSVKVIKEIKTNIKIIDSSDSYKNRITIINKKFSQIELQDLLIPGRQNILFADPPYNKGYVKLLLEKFAGFNKSENDIFIIEHSKHEDISEGKHYKFGDTMLTFL